MQCSTNCDARFWKTFLCQVHGGGGGWYVNDSTVRHFFVFNQNVGNLGGTWLVCYLFIDRKLFYIFLLATGKEPNQYQVFVKATLQSGPPS